MRIVVRCFEGHGYGPGHPRGATARPPHAHVLVDKGEWHACCMHTAQQELPLLPFASASLSQQTSGSGQFVIFIDRTSVSSFALPCLRHYSY